MAISGTTADGARVALGTAVGGLSGVWADPGDGPVRVVTAGKVLVAVWGDCGASVDDLTEGLGWAAAGDWEALTRWPGSYWVLADDGAGCRFVAGDLSGYRSVFYAADADGQVCWSASAAVLARWLGRGPDVELLVAHAVCGSLWPHRSAWRDVACVPGGYGLVLGRGTVRLVDVRGVLPLGWDDGAQALAAALRQEVHRLAGLAGPAGLSCDLSGGLDSSTVAVLAAEAGPVCAVTWAGELASREDTTFAVRVAASLADSGRAVRHHVCSGGGHLDVLRVPVRTDAPVACAVTWGMDAAYLAPAAGRTHHLTGHGGDVVLDADALSVWLDLVRAGHRKAAKRQVIVHARMRDSAPGRLWSAVRQAAGTNRRDALHRLARNLDTAAAAAAGWPWVHVGPDLDVLTVAGRDAVARLLAEAAETAERGGDAEADDWASLRGIGQFARDEAVMYAAHGVAAVAHPFLTNSVVRAAFAVPPAERHRPGEFKALLAAALPDLPGWLTGRRSKGSFSPALYAALRAREAAVVDLIQTSALVSAGLVDPERAAVLVRETAAGRSTGSLVGVQGLVVASMWLSGLDETAVGC